MYLNLSHYFETLSLGETYRGTCPRCQGGSSKQDTFTVTLQLDGTLIWNCFRDSCPLRGTTAASGQVSEKAIKRERKTWTGDTVPLPQEVREWILSRWGITDPRHWYYTEDYGGRIAMSIRSPQDAHRGWLLRNDGTVQPKALTFVDEGQEGLSWYKTVPHAPTLIVEDIPSAVRAAAYVNSVALLGTGIGLSRAEEIAEYATRPIVLALDQDAIQTSFKWARKYSLLWGDVQVLPLKQDLKDMKEADLCKFLQEFSSHSDTHFTK